MINKFDGEFAFLSNFFNSTITDGNIIFPTVEHYYQAAKTTILEEYKAIAAATTPGKAKRLGRTCTLRHDWEQVKDIIMWKALQEKFTIPELKAKLLATGDAYLEEGNWWHDNHFGNCHCIKCQKIQGENIWV